MGKKWTIKWLLLILAVPFAHGQTPESCSAAVAHLSVPATVEFPAIHPASHLTPIRYLFEWQGIEVYSILDLKSLHFLDLTNRHSATVMLVYQEDHRRQQAIAFLRSHFDGPPDVSESFAKVKIAIAQLMDIPDVTRVGPPGSARRKAAAARWKPAVDYMQFYEPKECIIIPDHLTKSEVQNLAAAGARNRRDLLNDLNYLSRLQAPSNVPVDDERRFPDGKILLDKIMVAMRQELVNDPDVH